MNYYYHYLLFCVVVYVEKKINIKKSIIFCIVLRDEKNCSFAGKRGYNAGGWGKIEYAPMVIGEVERNGVTTSSSRIEKSNPSRRRSLQRSYNELVEVFKSPISRRFNRAMSSKGSVQQSVLPPERNKKNKEGVVEIRRALPFVYTKYVRQP